MILYLHGRSIRGNDLNMVKRYGPPAFLDKRPDFPFVVVSPQLPEASWPADSLIQLVDEMASKYRVDKDRIYLTGVSMGGGGIWYLAARDQEKFAAMAPICGNCDASMAPRLDNIPIWAFHGAQDKVTPLGPHQRLVDAVIKAGGNAKMTVIPDGTHGNIIYPTYQRQDLYDWFLTHSRAPEAEKPAVSDPVAVEPKPGPPARPVEDRSSYIVKKGDTLWGISKRNGITVDALMKANRLRSSSIRIGQKLAIPTS